MTKDEALRLALEALEGVLDDSPKVLDASISGGLYEVVQCQDAITAIKAALEANEFNPDWDTQAVLVEEIQRMAKRIEEQEAKDEPWTPDDMAYRPDGLPQRPWVGLTDKEAAECWTYNDRTSWKNIEAALKDKNL
jgi:hypothetical protein